MAYQNVATLPFLLDSSHLTPEEVLERAQNPTLWASKRYGQPEHIFEAAGKRIVAQGLDRTELDIAQRHMSASRQTTPQPQSSSPPSPTAPHQTVAPTTRTTSTQSKLRPEFDGLQHQAAYRQHSQSSLPSPPSSNRNTSSPQSVTASRFSEEPDDHHAPSRTANPHGGDAASCKETKSMALKKARTGKLSGLME